MTHYLKFPDEETARNALDAAGFVADGQVIAASHTHAIDVVGEIVRDGEIFTGWHINYIGNLPQEWEQYVVNPKNPARMFLTTYF